MLARIWAYVGPGAHVVAIAPLWGRCWPILGAMAMAHVRAKTAQKTVEKKQTKDDARGYPRCL